MRSIPVADPPCCAAFGGRAASSGRAASLRLAAVALLAPLALAAGVARATPAGPYLDIPNVPFYVGQSVPPNILLTIDDSGSMMWGYVPDNFGGILSFWATGSAAEGSKTIAFKSNLNGLYYRPSVTYVAPTDENGNAYTTSFTNAPNNGFAPAQGTVNLATSYRPNQFYDSSQLNQYGIGATMPTSHCRSVEQSGSNCPGVNVAPNTGTRAYYWTYNINAAAGCPDQIPDGTWWPAVSCFTFQQVQPAEEQNFAIWYSFYRTRNLATVSSALLAFRNLPTSYRIGWQSLNSCVGGSNSFSSACRGWDTSRTTVDARIGPYTAAKRSALWSWLTRLPSYNGTPLLQALDRAGQYLSTTGNMSPYADTLGDPSTGYASCRQSYSVMMTDGSWNSAGPYSSVGNEDGTPTTLPDGTSYTPDEPYKDTNTQSLADVAFKYWRTDLQPTLTNNIRQYLPYAASSTPSSAEYWDPRNDPATWQHMTSFFVGLGLSKNLKNPTWMGSTFAGSSSSPYSGYYSVVNGMAWPTTGPDAAGNTHDMWHGAINSRGAFFSVETADALIEAFNQINTRIAQGAGASTAASASSFQTQTDSMVFTATYDTIRWDATIKGFKVNADGSVSSAPSWSTDDTLAFLGAARYTSPANKVLVRNSGGSLIQFSATNLASMKSADVTALNNGASALGVSTTSLVNWILGDDSNLNLRSRTRLLGDVLGSQPVFEGGRDYGYVETAWAGTPRIDGNVYAQYVAKKSSGGANYAPTVYVGSNDGMLHAFDATTGQRRWAYIPSPVLANIHKRAMPAYAHTYFVDGQITIHDVHDGSNWRTILVGSLGAGGKVMYALDITVAGSPVLLWERVGTTADSGYMLGEPVIARAGNGTWVVVIGNGVGSDGNVASLLVLDALSGTTLKTLTPAQATVSSAQGMSSPALLYLAGRVLGYAYAGDWQGNLWRFNFNDPNPANWSVDFGGLPLFQARGPGGAVQRITAKPRIISDRALGRIIVFGTGKMLESTDKDDMSVQTLYGVYDRASGSTATRGSLTQQTITGQTGTTRTVSMNALPTSSAGWYLDLLYGSAAGERIITAANYLPEQSLILSTTLQPSGGACDSSLNSALMALNPWTGAGKPVLDVGGTLVSGVRTAGMVASPTVVRGKNRLSIVINRGTQGTERVTMARGFNPRAAWRQLR